MFTLDQFIGLFFGSLFAGGFGAMFGLGGGFIVVPLLTIFFKVPIHMAVATSLLCVVATSQSAALAKPSSKFTNIRLVLCLEVSTVIGAIAGGLLATFISAKSLKIIFGCALTAVLLWMIKKTFSPKDLKNEEPSEDLENSEYNIKNLEFGIFASTGGGILSSMLGIGGGIIKVPIMRAIMDVPFRIAVATSNFMVGITATTGAIFYYTKDYINPYIAFPCILGIVFGAFLGGNIGPKIKSTILEKAFIVVLGYFAIRMLINGFGA